MFTTCQHSAAVQHYCIRKLIVQKSSGKLVLRVTSLSEELFKNHNYICVCPLITKIVHVRIFQALKNKGTNS